MPQENPPRIGSIDETTGGNHHHKSADDEKYIDSRRAIFPIHSGCCGINALIPRLERVKKDDEQGSDSAERLNGQEVFG
jgi:hypothetical protein